MPIDYACQGAVGYITLNRPPGNNYDLAGMEELNRAIQAAANDTSSRVVILRSGIRALFCLGADVGYLSEAALENNIHLAECAHATLSSIAEVPKPFIALLEGHTLGGGLEIALACDFRFAAKGNYFIGLPEAGLGIMPGNGGTQRLSRLVGPTKALDLLFSARRLNPSEANELGIVDHLFPLAEAARSTHEYAERLAAGASTAIGAIKLAVWQGIERPLSEALTIEKNHATPLLTSPQFREGLQAFLEKRPPKFHS
ncbi:enoyl-CoA hydratase/isomerase family protein [Bythopirellula polymerisocia]|uniref:Putative enoyl-CoA hydratase echA8 n=1 Tax=Bythopirellula polymerisocia TaxID=2528003 RepID=A0A5C6CNE8_9BACT|nr:enoyl-CoA hydratase/isomerase family protein [Bythopirellula polymerisocia]TWU26050.1 putative enoyl-CoA hydratase echA8 [Bythopirellula polymerisocia]